MWRSIRLLRDWAMSDILTPHRPRLPNDPMHVSAEVGGLVLANQAVPWHADAVIVEASLRLPAANRRKEDFSLRLPGRDPALPDTLRRDDSVDRYILVFRVPPLAGPATAELVWRERVLGRVEIATVSAAGFLDSLRLQFPTVHARLGAESVGCQTFVAAQCQGLIASGLLTSPTSLAPLATLGLSVEFRSETTGALYSVDVPLSGSQLIARQALVTGAPRKLPRRTGAWMVTWRAADRVLASTRLRTVGAGGLGRSLRVVGTRFVIDDGAHVALRRQAPAVTGSIRVGPCFFVASSEPGLAARCDFEIVPVGNGVDLKRTLAQSVLITDAPTPVAPGTLPAEEMVNVQAFELLHRGKVIGQLPVHPVPSAVFTAEGGFLPPVEFAWTSSAEDELADRLSKLIGD